LTAAQRYGVLVTTRNDSLSNFAMVGSMDTVSSLVPCHGDIAKTPTGSVRHNTRVSEPQCHRLAYVR
jgi:hypothetical protein